MSEEAVYRLVRKHGPTGSYLVTEPANAAARSKARKAGGPTNQEVEISRLVKAFLKNWEGNYALTHCTKCFGTGAVVENISEPLVPCPCSLSVDKPRFQYFAKKMMAVMQEVKELM